MDHGEWVEYAKRELVPNEDIERAWIWLVSTGKVKESAAERARRVVREALDPAWIGYAVPPIIGNTAMSNNFQAVNREKYGQDPEWARRRSKALRRLFDLVDHMIALYPLENSRDIVQRAAKKLGVKQNELRPEDWQALQLDASWRQNGWPKTKNSAIGGAPGGPFRQSGSQGAP